MGKTLVAISSFFITNSKQQIRTVITQRYKNCFGYSRPMWKLVVKKGNKVVRRNNKYFTRLLGRVFLVLSVRYSL